MKKIYWRPHRVPNALLFLVALLSLAGFISVEFFRIKRRQPYYREKIAASRLARNAMEAIKDERLKRKISIDPEVDPLRSGLIGVPMSPVTTDTGYLAAKQTSLNPNFAAVIVHLLKQAGVKEGDLVALGVSGSFPALNIAAYAAVQTLKLKPIVISSAAASQWGANAPSFLWIDMERSLFDRHIFSFRSIAATRGGVEDRGFGMSKEGRTLLDEAIQRNGLRLIEVTSLTDGVNKRKQIYEEQAGTSPLKAYINIGGGTASVGTVVGKKIFKPGLNRTVPRGASIIDSVMTRFANEGVPVIHMVYVAELARRYGLPLQPKQPPPIGEGKVFYKEEYNLPLAIGVLLVILGSMFVFIRMDFGFRILHTAQQSKSDSYPEQMI